MLTIVTASAFVTVWCGMFFLKTTRCVFPFTMARVLKNNVAMVVVFIPPAVPIEEPPINIKK